MRADGYAIATNKEAQILFPTVDLENINDIILVSAQRRALQSFIGHIQEVLDEHDKYVELLDKEQGVSRDNRNSNAKRKSKAKK